MAYFDHVICIFRLQLRVATSFLSLIGLMCVRRMMKIVFQFLLMMIKLFAILIFHWIFSSFMWFY